MTLRLADTILFNGAIITLDDRQPRASAVAIAGGRVVACGGDDDMLALAGAGTRRENLNGRCVIPGLIDAHLHWQATTEVLSQVQLFDLPDRATAVARAAERAAQTPAGEWIRGYGWSQDEWADKQFPSAADLDAVAPHHPVYLRARSSHAGWANSLALRLSGIDANTPDPEGGQIVHGPDGQPTGLLLEPSAMNLVEDRIPLLTPDALADQMRGAQALALSLGLTGFHDYDNQTCFTALQILRERGELALRVVKNLNKAYLDAALTLGLRRGFGDAWLRIGGLKIFADGAMGPRTASMIAPYDGEPDNYGIIVTDREEMVELVGKASAAGLASTIHAIGDRAVHDVLDVYAEVRRQEAARGEARSTRRHRIEHVQLTHPDDVDRLADLQIIASMQPIHATSDYPMADRYWGSRTPYSYNPRLQLERGVVVAFGSDSPVEPMDPIRGIHAAVTRRCADGSPGPDGWHPEARISIDQALRGYTLGPAYAAGLEDQQGRLAPGYLADLVVLDRDLYATDPDELLATRVVATMVDGAWRFGGLD
jgi:predicted amidohydrolase YtcJ